MTDLCSFVELVDEKADLQHQLAEALRSSEEYLRIAAEEMGRRIVLQECVSVQLEREWMAQISAVGRDR